MSLGLGWGLRICIPTSSEVTVVALLVCGPHGEPLAERLTSALGELRCPLKYGGISPTVLCAPQAPPPRAFLHRVCECEERKVRPELLPPHLITGQLNHGLLALKPIKRAVRWL